MNGGVGRVSGDTLPGIQILRAVAALLIVFHHADWLVKSNIAVVSWPRFGAAGVDLFFVVSGFIICLTTSRSHDPALFMQKRIARIVPLYWSATLLTFAVMCIDVRFLGWQNVDVANLIKSLLFIPYYSGGGGFTLPILYVGWSLNYEMLFYGLWAVTLIAFPHAVGGRVLLISIILAGLVLVGHATEPSRAIPRFYTQPIMLEFAFGALIGWAYLRHRSLFAKAPVSVCAGAVLMALAAFAVFHGNYKWRLSEAMLATVVVCSVLALEARGIPLRNALLEALGDASYAIYLTHPLILQAASRIPFADWLQPGIGPMLVIGLVVLTAIGGIGLGFFYWFERPMNRLLRDWRGVPAGSHPSIHRGGPSLPALGPAAERRFNDLR
jgi:exopolysaccharide production protein ExoZ